MLQDIHF